MVLGMATAAAAASGGTGATLFQYNRENFLYDRKMRQETEYQIMDFRIKQAELWREDVKDIIGLTSVKMDTYLIVNAVQLGFCVMAFCEGRLAAGTPTWLIGCHTLCLGGAFMYLLMSVWFSMHASVTAKAYEVRLLTQHVRLPVPTWAQLEGARTYASGFEKVQSKQMFRVPFAMGTQEKVLQTGPTGDAGGSGGRGAAAPAGGVSGDDVHRRFSRADSSDLNSGEPSDLWGLEARGEGIYELDGTLRSDPRNMRHLRLVHEAMQYWQSYDGFARVAMSMGTNQLVTALAYYVIAYVLVSNKAVIACWLAVLLFMVINSALIRLDMSLTGFEYRSAVALVTSGPIMAAVAAQQWMMHKAGNDELVKILAPIIYVTHAVWLLFLLYVCKVSEQKNGSMLPIGFRSVMYIDIFGWIKSLRPPARRGRSSMPAGPPTSLGASAPGCGPAVQAVRYEDGRPVPTRPEQLPGAAAQPPDSIKREDFEPATFIPRMRDEGEDFGDEEVNQDGDLVVIHKKPGFVPWRIFFYATMTLIVLWWISGLFVLIKVFDIDWFKVAPLLRVEHEEHLPGHESHEASLIQRVTSHLEGGEPMPTMWPRQLVRPVALACTSDGGGRMVSLSRFGLFSAPLPSSNCGGGICASAPMQTINFTSAPPCTGIEGESLRDASLACGADVGGGCAAFVLHRQGQLVSQCRVSWQDAHPSFASLVEGGAAAGAASAMSFADSWLDEGDALRGAPQEEVDSVAFIGRCSTGAGSCAFAETSARRVVEMRADGKVGRHHVDWYPSRVVQSSRAHREEPESDFEEEQFPSRSLSGLESGTAVDSSLRVLGDPHRPQQLLGMLRTPPPPEYGAEDEAQQQQSLEVIDAATGAPKGAWALPSKHRWTSMCSASGSLYLLAAGTSPEVWRFPLPEELRGSEEHSAAAPQLAQSNANIKEPRVAQQQRKEQQPPHSHEQVSQSQLESQEQPRHYHEQRHRQQVSAGRDHRSNTLAADA